MQEENEKNVDYSVFTGEEAQEYDRVWNRSLSSVHRLRWNPD